MGCHKITGKGNSGKQPHFNSVDFKANRAVWVGGTFYLLELSMETSTRLVCDLENPLKFFDAYYLTPVPKTGGSDTRNGLNSTSTLEDFWRIDKSQHSLKTCEASSSTQRCHFSYHWK